MAQAIHAPHAGFLKLLANHTDASPHDIVKVDEAIKQVLAGSIPWWQILMTIIPFILSIFSGGTVDIAALIAAIMALLNPPGPTP